MNAVGDRSGGRIATVIILPMIAVVALAAIFIFCLMIWSSRISDEAAESSQRQLLKGAVQLARTQMADQQVGSVVWDQAYFRTSGPILDNNWVERNICAWLYENHSFSKTILVGRNLETPYVNDKLGSTSWVTPALMDQLSAPIAKTRARYITAFKKNASGLYHFIPAFGAGERSLAETGIIRIADDSYLYSAAAITQESNVITAFRRPPMVLINFKKLNGPLISEIARVSGLEGLALSSRPATQSHLASVPLIDPKGHITSYLQWHVGQPGTEMLQRMTPLLLILALAIAGLTIGVIDFTRQTTRKLARSQSQAVYAARHDALSGLPNRERFNLQLSEALLEPQEPGDETAVVYIDLDRFKNINDTLGHAAGDEVIRSVATRLRLIVPETGSVARISGDEFAMLLTHCRGQLEIESILTRLQDHLLLPIRIGANELVVGLSLGIAVSPQDGLDAGELLRKADIALYEAKANGRGRWAFFEPSMQEHVQIKDEMARDLRRAIDQNELTLAYQPQCDKTAEKIVAIEALARWTHPTIGVISPTSFIPIAEETGLMDDLGLWVLRRACRDAHRWPKLAIAVNVSPTQFKHPRFVERVIAILEEFNLAPGRLELEVTESVFAGSDNAILRSLKRLKDLGVKVALDDFGSGYSSLSYLRRFPFDTLKVDRDFISAVHDSPEAQAILRTIIQLGKALGMTIVAEGVEERQQIDFLRDNDCHRMQGYYISRPLSVEALDEFLMDHELHSEMNSRPDENGLLRAAKA